ncbi:MAG: hypothetical protein ACI9UJ_001495, partial [bacterium]
EFDEQMIKINNVLQSVEDMEDALDIAKAPYTPGRKPKK